ARQWCDVEIAVPYRPPLGGEEVNRWLRLRRQSRRGLTDPATWRGLLGVVGNASRGWRAAAPPAAAVAGRVATTFAAPPGVQVAPAPHNLTQWLVAMPLGLATLALGLRAGPRLLTTYGILARTMLGPTRQAELALRVRHLAETRTDAIDTGAAEMRRIERDLHDGAQARLVAMGMTLDAADQLIETSPAAARALLAEARDSSVKALAEL